MFLYIKRSSVKSYEQLSPLPVLSTLQKTNLDELVKLYTAWKVSVFRIFLVRIFPHLDWIRTRKTPSTDTFYAVILYKINNNVCNSLKIQQWKDKLIVIVWLKSIEQKRLHTFIIFDIKNFYPSIDMQTYQQMITKLYSTHTNCFLKIKAKPEVRKTLVDSA